MSSEGDFVTRNHASSSQAGHPHPPERATRAGPQFLSATQTTVGPFSDLLRCVPVSPWFRRELGLLRDLPSQYDEFAEVLRWRERSEPYVYFEGRGEVYERMLAVYEGRSEPLPR